VDFQGGGDPYHIIWLKSKSNTGLDFESKPDKRTLRIFVLNPKGFYEFFFFKTKWIAIRYRVDIQGGKSKSYYLALIKVDDRSGFG
jgi:hypothetical protein